ncbi:MAG: hypothetical protein IBJ18_14225, partial [Phycisphaerales bacterium]|nr:hypothetical protein [Phycisphaerales bacterium]
MSSTGDARADGPIVGIDLGTTNSLVAVAGGPRRLDLARVPEGAGGVGAVLLSGVRGDERVGAGGGWGGGRERAAGGREVGRGG